MELKELYQEIILDHAKNPRNKGKCEGYNHDAKAHNPLCGDKVHIYLKLDKENNISSLSFEGEGCAISLASASILTDTLKGRDLQFSKKVTDDFLSMLKNKTKITHATPHTFLCASHNRSCAKSKRLRWVSLSSRPSFSIWINWSVSSKISDPKISSMTSSSVTMP